MLICFLRQVPSTPVKPCRNSSGNSGPDGQGLFLSLVSTPLRRTLYGFGRKGSDMGNRNGNHSTHGGGVGGGNKHSTSMSASNHRPRGGGGDGGDALDRSSSSSRNATITPPKKYNGSAAGNLGTGGRRGRGAVRRPADGRAPGRRDPAAVAKLEAAAKRAAAELELEREGTDPSWRLPTNVDYYTDRGERVR